MGGKSCFLLVTLLLAFTIWPLSPAHAYGSCESGHWIKSVIDDGKIIQLEDGSLWEVSDIDTVDSALWLPISNIVICDDKLINTDDNEAVEATRIQ